MPVKHLAAILSFVLLSAGPKAQAQPQQDQASSPATTTSQAAPQANPNVYTGRSPGGDVGSGSGDIGKDVAGVTGRSSKGVGKGTGRGIKKIF
jgi:hypothetical protein